MASMEKDKVAYLGPKGTYTHQAAAQNFPYKKYLMIPVPTIEAVFGAVTAKSVHYGVVPFENSTNGTVASTLDLLADLHDRYPDIVVTHEIYMKVRHYLLGPVAPPNSGSGSDSGSDSGSPPAPENQIQLPILLTKDGGEPEITPGPAPEIQTELPLPPSKDGGELATPSGPVPENQTDLRALISKYGGELAATSVQTPENQIELPTLTSKDGGELATTSGEATPTQTEPKQPTPRGQPLSSIKHIKAIFTHPQAWDQCKNFFFNYASTVERYDAESTAKAATRVMEDETGTHAAISSKFAAKIYGLNILAESIEDNTDNCTRFFVIRPWSDVKEKYAQVSVTEEEEFTRCKTLVSFKVNHDVPGSLADALAVFGEYALNLTSINTRPSGVVPWQYTFFVEFEGRKRPDGEGGAVNDAFEELGGIVESYRWLGSWDNQHPESLHPSGSKPKFGESKHEELKAGESKAVEANADEPKADDSKEGEEKETDGEEGSSKRVGSKIDEAKAGDGTEDDVKEGDPTAAESPADHAKAGD